MLQNLTFAKLLQDNYSNYYKDCVHEHKMFTNKSLKWLAMDSEHHREMLLKDAKAYKLLEQNGWLNDEYYYSVKYDLNKYGLRFDLDFKHENSIMFLGCSHTFGLALPKHLTWTVKVSKALSMNEINLGWPARSLDACARVLIKWLRIFNPKILVLLIPNRGRFELIDDEGKKEYPVYNSELTTNSHEITSYHKICHSFDKPDNLVKLFKLNLQPTNVTLNILRNTALIQEICNLYKTKLYLYEAQNMFEIHEKLFAEDYARDISHYGVKTNDYIGNYIIDHINNL